MSEIVTIDRLNNEGKGISKIDNKIVFVDNALPLEKVEIDIKKDNKNYFDAKCTNILEKSKDRVNPICPYYDLCGGCNLMHMNYDYELEFKKEKIKNIFKKICNIDIKIDKIEKSDLNYRNKVVLKVQNDKIGFYSSKTNEVVDIDKCIISNDKINEILLQIKDFIKEHKNNNIKEIMIRVLNDKSMICLDNINEKIKDVFLKTMNNIDSIYIDNKLSFGEKTIIQKQNNLDFIVSPKSFFQVNKSISEKMYNRVSDFINEDDVVLDLYSGTGTISSIVSKKSKKVIGIEVVSDAVKDANKNIENNEIKNVSFITSKVEDSIEKISEKVDTIILDPPRSGSDRKTINTILKYNPKRIIYISCNQITLARDYNLLKYNYEIHNIELFDMFRETYHVETVMILERK